MILIESESSVEIMHQRAEFPRISCFLVWEQKSLPLDDIIGTTVRQAQGEKT